MAVPVAPSATRGRAAAVATGLALLLIVGVTALVVRGITDGSGPVLPLALCRAGQSIDFLPPLDARRAFTSWQGDGLYDLVTALAALAYAWGARAYRRRTGHRWPWTRSVVFGVGLVLLVLATNSALAVYDMTLFSVHMIQHLVLIMVIPAFLVLARPLTLLMAVSDRARHVAMARAWAYVFSAPVALGAYAAVLVGTHLTGVMGEVMRRPWAGQVEHALYLVVGLQFFAAAIGNAPVPWRLSHPGRIFLVMASMAVDAFVGVVLLMSVQPIAMLAHPGWGPTPLADTHLGGAIMWVAGDGLMAIVPIAVYLAWARTSDNAVEIPGWYERARVAQLMSHGVAEPDDDGAIDADDAQLEAYNRWLASLQQRG